MILVLLGTQHNEFTRLLKEVENCINKGIIKEEVIVQAGFTKFETAKMQVFDMISQDTLNDYIDKSNLIITHGGVGSIIVALKKRKKVIAVPRLSRYNEHVNDHQIQIVETFNKKGFLIGIQDVTDLSNAIEKSKTFIPEEYKSDNKKMIDIIEKFIENI